MGRERRRDGVNGWVKVPCPWSRTHWAWGWDHGGLQWGCKCIPCTPPKNAEERERQFGHNRGHASQLRREIQV